MLFGKLSKGILTKSFSESSPPYGIMATAITRLLMQRPKAIFLNAARLDYDKALSFSRLSNLTDLTLHDVDCIKSSDDIVKLVNSSKAEIVITKEMEVTVYQIVLST